MTGSALKLLRYRAVLGDMHQRQTRQAGYGKGVHVIDIEDRSVDAEDVTARLMKVFRDPAYQPPRLPQVGLDLLALTRKPDVEISQVLKLLETDSMLAARVLGIAQSPVYSRSVAVQSLEQALVRLGLHTVSDIVLEASLQLKVFRAPGYDAAMAKLQRHSAATAHLSRIISRKTGVFSEYAFLCGLTHDIGLAAGMLALGHGTRTPPPLDDVHVGLDQAHCHAGGMLAHLWKLPADVGLVLRHHHDFTVDGRLHPVAAIVALADAIASDLGACGGFPPDPSLAAKAAAAVGLSKTAMTLVLAEGAVAVSQLVG